MQRRRRSHRRSIPCKELTHWGHAFIQEHHLQLDPTRCDLGAQPTSIVIDDQVMVWFRTVWVAGNSADGGLLDDDGWQWLADPRDGKNETCGGLLEFLMRFGCMGPFCLTALVGHLGMQRIHRVFSDMSMGRAMQADRWRQRAPAGVDLADQERQALAQVLESGVMPIGMKMATQPLRALEDQNLATPAAGTETAPAAPREAPAP